MHDGKYTVLIVDDEPFNREIIIEYIEDEGYDLKTAEDGAIAWDMLQTDPEGYDVVLLDRMMPNMDGMTLLKLIKDHEQLQSLPVILQTALASRQNIADGMAAGAFYYLTKPFEEENLISVVATAVGDRARHLQIQKKIDLSSRMLALLKEGTFRFRDLDEARDMASILANLCPDPQRVIVGMSELLINAVEHGNLGITYEEKGKLKENGSWEDEVKRRLQDPELGQRQVDIYLKREDERLLFTITDEGEGFDYSKYLEMDPARAFDNHGRGIAMSRLLSFDHFEYQGNGNQVVVGINLPQEG